MEKHSCKTYISVAFDFDMEANVTLIKNKIRECTPEQLGIFNKPEVERELRKITDDIVWNRHHFEIGKNTEFDIDINNMIRKTLKDLFGKEEFLKDLQQKYGVTIFLNLVPTIVCNSESPSQLLSLDNDIIEFLYKSQITMDLDYYVI